MSSSLPAISQWEVEVGVIVCAHIWDESDQTLTIQTIGGATALLYHKTPKTCLVVMGIFST
jgi:hypothetical protein